MQSLFLTVIQLMWICATMTYTFRVTSNYSFTNPGRIRRVVVADSLWQKAQALVVCSFDNKNRASVTSSKRFEILRLNQLATPHITQRKRLLQDSTHMHVLTMWPFCFLATRVSISWKGSGPTYSIHYSIKKFFSMF